MIKDSFLDLNNSRNDVVPQRTQMDDEQYAPVVPEGHHKNENEDSSSVTSSQMMQTRKIKLESGQKRRPAAEDDEAVAIASPNRRSRDANATSVF